MLTICISDPLLQKQFRKQNVWRQPEQDNEGSSQRSAFAFVDEAPANVPDGSQNEHRLPSLLPQFKKQLFNLIVKDAFPFALHSLNSKGQLMSEI